MASEAKPEQTKRKRKRKDAPEGISLRHEDEAAAQLESLLFGNLEGSVVSRLGHELDDTGNVGEELQIVQYNQESDVCARRPAWVDEEDEATTVNISNVNLLRKLRKDKNETVISGKEYVERLRVQHRKLNPETSWAELRTNKGHGTTFDTDDFASDDGRTDLPISLLSDVTDRKAGELILRNNADLVVKSKLRLPPGLINVTRMRDANIEEPSNAVVHSVEFHRNAQILMTAGLDKKLRFFQIDGKKNPKIQSIFLENFPIHKAAFIPDGSKVLASGRRKFFHVYNMEVGRVDKVHQLIGREEKSLESFAVSQDSKTVAFQGNEGYILLTSLSSRQWIGNMKMNGSVRALSFAQDGKELLSIGQDGEVYTWDLRTRRCIHKGRDEGSFRSTSLSVSADSCLFATGSSSGVVNIYDRESFVGGATKPRKTLMNLVTSIDNIKFNCDSQILAMASRMKKDALRLVHLPSYTVFSNWPTSKTPLQYVHSLDFSPGGGYLAVGNAAGKVLLYRLHYYDNA